MNLHAKERGVSRLYAVDRQLKPRHEQGVLLFRKWAKEISGQLERQLSKPLPVKLRSEDVKAYRDRQISEILLSGLGKAARNPVAKHFTAAAALSNRPLPANFDPAADYLSVRKGRFAFAIKLQSRFARYYPEKELLHFGEAKPCWQSDEYMSRLLKSLDAPAFELQVLAIPVYALTNPYQSIPFHDHLVDNLLCQGQYRKANLLYFWRNTAQGRRKAQNLPSATQKPHLCGLLLLARIAGAPEEAVRRVEHSLARTFSFFYQPIVR